MSDIPATPAAPAAPVDPVTKFSGLYAGLDTLHDHLGEEQKQQLNGLLDMSADPNEAKARMVNQAYLQTVVPQLDDQTASTNWPAIKKTFAKQVLGVDKADISDTELYGGIAGHLQKQQAERTMMTDVVKKMTETAFSAEPGTWLDSYQAMLKGLEGNAGFNPANRDRYRQVAQQAFGEALQMKASLEPAADTVLASLRGERDVTDLKDFYAKGREANTGTPMDALDAIKAIPADQRPLLYSLIAQKGTAEGQKQGGAASFGANVQKAIGNMLTDLYHTNRLVFDNAALVHAQMMAQNAGKIGVVGQPEPGESMLDFVNRANPGARGIVDFLGDVVRGGGTPATRPLTADEQNQLKAQVADLKDTADIARSLKDLSRGVVDPIVGTNALTRKVLYPAIGMAGPVAEAMVPYVGLPLLINTTVGQSVEAFSRQGMAPEQAQKLGLIAGAVQAPLVMVSGKMVAGNLPFLKGLITEPVAQTLAGITARGATLFAVEAGTQNVLAAAQELTPPTVQWLASKMTKDYPGVDWSAELKGFSGRRIDTFWAMLPMVAVGTGVATFSDAAYGRQYLGNMKLLRAAGFDEAMAKRIIDAPTLEAREQIVRELWPEMDHENTAAQLAHFDDLDAEMRASYHEHAPADGPSTVRLDDGTYEVRDQDGNPIDITTTPEAALELMQEHQRASAATLGEAVNDMVDYVRGIHEEGQTTEVTGLKRTLADRIKAGDITPEDAAHAIDVAVSLGHLEAGTRPEDVAVAGENQGKHNARTGLFEDVSLIHDGADPLTVIEEHAEGYLKRRLHTGELSVEDLARWRDQVDGPGGDQTQRGLTEWFSNMAKAYITGHADNVTIPATFRVFLNKLRDYFTAVMDTAARLMTLEREGKLPDGFQKHLARATGLDEGWLMARARGEEKAAAVGKPLELGDWIRGKLPHPKSAAAKGEALAGELRDLWQGMQETRQVKARMERPGQPGRKSYSMKSNAKAQAFFAKEADYGTLDSIAQMAREAGFNDIMTPADLLDAVDKSLRGIPTYAHPIERGQVEQTFGLKPDVNQTDMFAGGETGGDKLFNLHGEEGKDYTGIVDKQAAEREAKRKAEADQGELSFALAHREALDEIQRIFAPQSRGEDAGITAGMLREHGAELAQRADRAHAYLQSARSHLEAMPEAARWAFVNDVETGVKQATPELQDIADRFRKILDYKRGEVQALGKGALAHFIQDYFPHLWEDPKKAGVAFAAAQAKKPLEGGKSFLKERTIPTVADGLALGLKPVSSNPVDLVLLRAREMDKYILGQRWLEDMKTKGLLEFVRAGDVAPDGYAKINDKIATVYGPKTGMVTLPAGANVQPQQVGVIGRRILGEYWAPQEIAQVANNYLSPGLRGSKMFEAYLTAANTLNQFQLGLSAFHLGFTSLDAATSKLALGIEQLVAGELKDAAKSIAGTAAAPFTNAIKGDKVLNEWFKPGSQGAEIAAIVDSLKAAGGRAQMDAFYQTTMTKKMLEAFRRGGSGYLEAGLRALPAGIELAAKPIMEWIVPRQKLGIFADLARRELANLPKNATRDDVRAVMAKAWDSVDNRMGQMVYDNLFWNKAAKDLSMASVRSLGWNLGTLRELGGGVLDTVAAGKALVTGNAKTAEFTHRMAYVAAMPILTGLLGAMTQYLLTGKGPEELKDYFFPKTGERDPQGREVRLTMPSYMKDVAHYSHDPVGTITGKVHPAISLVADMLNNKDYFGRPIRHEDDPIVKQALDGAKHVAEQFMPMGIGNAIKSNRAQTGRGEQMANFVGITKAPQWLSMSPAEQLAQKLVVGKMGPETPQPSQEKMDAKQRALAGLRNGTQEQRQKAAADIDAMVASGKLTKTEARNLLRSSAKVYLVDRMQHLDAREAMRVYRVATPEERAVLKDVIGAKIVRAQLPTTDKIELMHSLETLSKK